jgi:hypothetical protein
MVLKSSSTENPDHRKCSVVTAEELYHHFISEFYSFKDCENTILVLCDVLQVSRCALGIYITPKGMYYDDVTIENDDPNDEDYQRLLSNDDGDVKPITIIAVE